MISFKQISPVHVSALWHWIKPGIDRLLKKCPDDFQSGHVFAGLTYPERPGGASCFLIFLDGEYQGFIILEVGIDPFGGRRTLNVWLMYFRKAEIWQEAIYEFLDRLKVQANCIRIHMKSPRLGWLKKAKGFKLKLITWERV